MIKESESEDVNRIPQFRNRRDLLQWILDRITYLQKTKVTDFMLFFTSDEANLMKNPDKLYTLMFNHLGKHAADIAMDRFRELLPQYLPPDMGFYMDAMGYPNYMSGMGGTGPQMGMEYNNYPRFMSSQQNAGRGQQRRNNMV